MQSTREEKTTLSGVLRRHLSAYAAGGVFLAAFQYAMNRIDWLSKQAIDAVFGADPRAVWRPALLMLAIAVAAFAVRVASRWFIFNAGRDAEYELRGEILGQLHKLGASFYRTMSSGELMSRATNDLTQVRLLFGFGILNIINMAFAFASTLQVELSISAKLTFACLLNLPLLLLLSTRVGRLLYPRTRSNQEALGHMSDVVQANLAGVRVVRSFGLEELEARRFEEANQRYLTASLSLARLRGSMMPLTGAASAVSMLIFFGYGGTLLLRGTLTKGDFFAFWLALGRMAWPMIAVGFALSIIQRGRAGFARIAEILDTEPEVSDGPVEVARPLSGELRVDKLRFSHGAREVLRDVSFTVPEGASLAIVGRTGSGKSTLAMLLSRLLPTPRGAVSFGGYDVCDVPLAKLRAAIGYAQQDAFLFSASVARNMGFSLDEHASASARERVRAAAADAAILAEVEALADGFDTVVGERGVQLSGGQRQRTALARALLWEPALLILDDPLSAVDAKTEGEILAAIERRAKDRTLLLITHRVAAAARCTQIIVLDDGRIIERGTHDELLHGGGLYAAFAEEQLMARELEELDAAEASS